MLWSALVWCKCMVSLLDLQFLLKTIPFLRFLILFQQHAQFQIKFFCIFSGQLTIVHSPEESARVSSSFNHNFDIELINKKPERFQRQILGLDVINRWFAFLLSLSFDFRCNTRGESENVNLMKIDRQGWARQTAALAESVFSPFLLSHR